MALTVDDLNAVRAQWEEWTADKGFRLQIEVKDEHPEGVMLDEDAIGLGVRVRSSLYCQVQVRRGDVLVFSERVPCDALMLRASVTVLARTIAGWDGDGG